VNHSLGDALVIEMKDLVAKDEVLEQRRAARASLQRVLVIGDRRTLLRCQHIAAASGGLVGLTTGGPLDFGIG
jgi:hypothetical protein